MEECDISQLMYEPELIECHTVGQGNNINVKEMKLDILQQKKVVEKIAFLSAREIVMISSIKS